MESFKKASKLDFDSFLFTASNSTESVTHQGYCPTCDKPWRIPGTGLINHVRKVVCFKCHGFSDNEIKSSIG